MLGCNFSEFEGCKGICADSQNGFGYTALHFAANSSRYQIVDLLLSEGANTGLKISKKNSFIGMTALDLARKRGCKDIIRLLENAMPQKDQEDKTHADDVTVLVLKGDELVELARPNNEESPDSKKHKPPKIGSGANPSGPESRNPTKYARKESSIGAAAGAAGGRGF